MTTYRTGNHWGVTIIRDGTQPPAADGTHADDHLVAVVLHDDAALAERIAWLLTHIRTPADRPHEDTPPQLTDRIIDAGPYTDGQVLPPELVREVFKTHELNQLRDELTARRRAHGGTPVKTALWAALAAAVLLAIVGGSWLIVDAVVDHDARVADETCHALNAEPMHIKSGRYLCVTSDGRVVGHT